MAKRKFFNRNTNVVLANVTAATMLLFCCIFYFIRNPKVFTHDITTYMAFFLVPFLCFLAFDLFYIIMLVVKLDTAAIRTADKFDLAYKIIFGITLAMFIVRSFLGNYSAKYIGVGDVFNIPIPIAVVAILSGIITWCTPKIKDNDNTEF